MAGNDKFTRIDIKNENEKAMERRIVKLETPSAPDIREYEYNRIAKPGDGNYAATRRKYGPLAATDADRSYKQQKDSRFALNSLVRDPLSVEQEERRVIEEKVRSRIGALQEESKAEAAAVGYEDGLEKGYQEAYTRFQKEAADRMKSLDALLAVAEGAKEEIYRANERFLIEMVFRIAKMVLLREATTDREYLTRLTREIVERVGVRENIKIRVSPEDFETVGMLKEDLEKVFGTLTNLSVESAGNVGRGGCTVETDWNRIDATLEMQLKGVYEALFGEGVGRAAPTGS